MEKLSDLALCINCRFWEIETEEIPELERVEGIKMYGKCNAVYTDKQGNTQRYSMGTIALSQCQAKDDDGNILFESKYIKKDPS